MYQREIEWVWTAFMWFRTGISGWLLWTRWVP